MPAKTPTKKTASPVSVTVAPELSETHQTMIDAFADMLTQGGDGADVVAGSFLDSNGNVASLPNGSANTSKALSISGRAILFSAGARTGDLSGRHLSRKRSQIASGPTYAIGWKGGWKAFVVQQPPKRSICWKASSVRGRAGSHLR
jgi:hypothetical protein